MELLRLLFDKCNRNPLRFLFKVGQMACLFVWKGLGPNYFMQARFWREGIPTNAMLRHFGAKEYGNAVNRLNHVRFMKLTQHKLAEKALLTLRRVPTPRYLGYFHNDQGTDSEGRPLSTVEHMRAFVDRHRGVRLCFKKCEGSGGSGFVALDTAATADGLRLVNPVTFEEWTVEQLFAYLRAFPSGAIIEEYFEQHRDVARLNPDSVNTLRIIVIRTSSGFEVRGAVLRVGRRGSQVDNTSSGGLACKVDLRSGEVIEALDLTPARHSYQVIPDTDVRVVGFVVPHWQECLALACRAVSSIPRLTLAGADIAIGVSGPCVIELNAEPDRRFATHLDLPHADLFAEAAKT